MRRDERRRSPPWSAARRGRVARKPARRRTGAKPTAAIVHDRRTRARMPRPAPMTSATATMSVSRASLSLVPNSADDEVLGPRRLVVDDEAADGGDERRRAGRTRRPAPRGRAPRARRRHRRRPRAAAGGSVPAEGVDGSGSCRRSVMFGTPCDRCRQRRDIRMLAMRRPTRVEPCPEPAGAPLDPAAGGRTPRLIAGPPRTLVDRAGRRPRARRRGRARASNPGGISSR